MEEWQCHWTESTEGRWTHRLIPMIYNMSGPMAWRGGSLCFQTPDGAWILPQISPHV